jgi:hypothetical protein
VNRRDLFRFASLATAAAIVPVAAQSTEHDWRNVRAEFEILGYPGRMPYVVFTNDFDGCVRHYCQKRESAIQYAYLAWVRTKKPVTVFGPFKEGIILSIRKEPNWRSLPAIL